MGLFTEMVVWKDVRFVGKVGMYIHVLVECDYGIGFKVTLEVPTSVSKPKR